MQLNMEGDDKEPEQNNFIKEFTIDEIQDGIRAEQLKNCSEETKEKSGQFSTKLHSRKTSHQRVGEKSEYK